jgi:sulfotransferase family protein
MAANQLLESILQLGKSTDPAPVLIGACARSGTTLLGAMLGASPEAVTVPEARFKWNLLESCGVAGEAIDLACAVRKLSGDWKFRQWGIELPPPDDIPAEQVPYAALLRHLALQYGLRWHKPSPKVWVDHTPGNVQYMARLGRVMPDSKFVHLVRDGRAVAASQIPLDWGPNDIFEAAQSWGFKVGMGVAACGSLGDDRAITVRYEDLVCEPQATLSGLCHFLRIAYDEGMVERRDYQVPKYTARQHQLVSAVPDSSHAELWRAQLTAEQIEAFEYLTGDMLVYLGYELDRGSASKKPRGAFHAVQSTRSLLRKRLSNPARRYLRRVRSRNP